MHTVPSEEARNDGMRVMGLLDGANSIDAVIQRLGAPDRDTSNQEPVIAGEGVPRIVVWCGASDYWAVVAMAWADGTLKIKCEPKAVWAS